MNFVARGRVVACPSYGTTPRQLADRSKLRTDRTALAMRDWTRADTGPIQTNWRQYGATREGPPPVRRPAPGQCVARGGGFVGPHVDGATGDVSGHLVKQTVLATAAHDMNGGESSSQGLLHLVQCPAVGARQTLQAAADELTGGLGFRLARRASEPPIFWSIHRGLRIPPRRVRRACEKTRSARPVRSIRRNHTPGPGGACRDGIPEPATGRQCS